MVVVYTNRLGSWYYIFDFWMLLKIHSLKTTSNQGVLLIGIKYTSKPFMFVIVSIHREQHAFL